MIIGCIGTVILLLFGIYLVRTKSSIGYFVLAVCAAFILLIAFVSFRNWYSEHKYDKEVADTYIESSDRPICVDRNIPA